MSIGREPTQSVWDLLAALNRPHALSEAGEAIARGLASLTGARALGVLSIQGDQVQLLAEHGLPNDYLQRFPLGQARSTRRLWGDLRAVVEARRVVEIASIQDDPRAAAWASAAKKGGLQAAIAAPIFFGGHLVGLLHGFFDDRHAASDVALFERCCVLLGATLYYVDAGSVDRGEASYGVAQLKRQLRKTHAMAGRYGRRYAVVAYQIRRGKVLADRYGAAFAEQALVRLSEVVAEQCRQTDASGVMGDGVGAVLPECDQEDAFTQAKRVLKAFGALSFSRGAQRLQVPIMAGISWWPHNGASSGQASFDSAAEAASQTEGAWVVALAGKGSARVPERA